MIFSGGCEKNKETGQCNCDSPTECDGQNILWESKNVNSPSTSDSVFYEESHFCSKIDDSPFKPCRSVHTVSENPAIEIRDESTISVDLPPITWHGYNSIPKLLNVCQAGRNVLINGQWSNGKPFIQGGPLNGSYIFSQIHFHAPSEHEIDGKRYPLEMHVVHYKTNYLTQERAMEEKDGTIVLVYLFEVKDSDDTVLSMITKQCSQPRPMPRQTEINGVSLNQIVKPFFSNYYIYWGSINTMKKSYLLQWIISCTLLYATEQEVYDIFHLMEGGNSTGRRVPLMKPLNNAVYYVGGYLAALKQEEAAIQCNSNINEVSVASQSCQTFSSVEENKKDIQVQVVPLRRFFKLRLEKCVCKAENCNHEPKPHYVVEEPDEMTKDKLMCKTPTEDLHELQNYKHTSSTTTNIPSHSHPCMGSRHYHYYYSPDEKGSMDSTRPQCETCKILKYAAKHSKCVKHDHFHSKSTKTKKEKRKLKGKGSKGSGGSSSLELNECETCKNQECTTENDPSKCVKNCECHSKKKSKEKQKSKLSKCFRRTSSPDLKECQICKNQECATENDSTKCVKNCECHSKKKSKKQKPKRKKSKSSRDTSSQDLDECQICKNLECTAEDKSLECVENCECHSKKKSKKQKPKSKKSKSSEESLSQDLDECQICKNLECTAEDKSLECVENCECHSKKKSKQDQKSKSKKSKCSEESLSQDLDECQICKKLESTAEDKSLECGENCECHSKKKSKEKKQKSKSKKSKCSEESSSQDLDECQVCKNLDCTAKDEPSKCVQNCECHSKKKSKKKQKPKSKKSKSSRDTSSQDLDECQICKHLKCTAEDESLEYVENCDGSPETRKKLKDKRKLKDKKSRNSSENSSQDFHDCQTCKNLKCSIENEPVKNNDCVCKCKCHKKPKKKVNCPKAQKKKTHGKKVAAEESSECEEKSKKKTKEKTKNKKTKTDDGRNSDSKSLCSKSKSKSKTSLTKDKNPSKTTCRTQETTVNPILTPFTVQKGPRTPKVLYKLDEKKKVQEDWKACNFLISEDSCSAFASTYRLPQLKTKEPLKEFFLQTEHLFHTEKKGGFSMCTSQDYHVTIVYNQNVLQEFKGTFCPNKLQLGDYEKLDLTPVYPEPDTVTVRLEDCFVKMETLNKLYIRAKFLLKPSVLNLPSNGKNEFLNADETETQNLLLLSETSNINFLGTQETYVLNNEGCGQSKSLEQFFTPTSSLNEKEPVKFIPQKQDWKDEGYEIKLLKKPPAEIETSKSNIFDADHSYETKIKKGKRQKTMTRKQGQKSKNLICKSKKNLLSTNNVEKNKTLEKKALTGKFKIKNITYPLCKKEDILPLSNVPLPLPTVTESLVIQNKNYLTYEKELNFEALEEEHDVTNQPILKTDEITNLDKEINTIILYYNGKENTKLVNAKNKIKGLKFRDQNTLKTPNADSSEASTIKKPRAYSCKSKLHKSVVSLLSPTLPSFIPRKSNIAKFKKKELLDSQKTVKKAKPSKIPISIRKRQQK